MIVAAPGEKMRLLTGSVAAAFGVPPERIPRYPLVRRALVLLTRRCLAPDTAADASALLYLSRTIVHEYEADAVHRARRDARYRARCERALALYRATGHPAPRELVLDLRAESRKLARLPVTPAERDASGHVTPSAKMQALKLYLSLRGVSAAPATDVGRLFCIHPRRILAWARAMP